MKFYKAMDIVSKLSGRGWVRRERAYVYVYVKSIDSKVMALSVETSGENSKPTISKT